MKINDISKRVGLPISTLHYYERIGLIVPTRGANKYRYYSEEDADQLILIAIMKEYDFTMNEIKEVMTRYTNPQTDESVLAEARSFFYDKIASIEQRIQEYQEMITIIHSFPLLANANSDKPKSKEETLELAYALHQKIQHEN